MTTSSPSIRGVASDAPVSLHRLLHQHRFARWCTAAQVIGDYLSIFAGTCVGLLVYHELYTAPRTDFSGVSVPGVATAIAALSVFQLLCIVDPHPSELSPLDILRSEQIARSIVCILASVTVICSAFHCDAKLVFIAGNFVMCSFLTQRKLVGSWIRSGRAMRHKSRAAIYGNRRDASTISFKSDVDRINWIWVGNILERSRPELGNPEECQTILGIWAEIDSIVAEHGITELVVTEQELQAAELRDILHDCLRLNLGLLVLADARHDRASFENNYIDGWPGCRRGARFAPHPLSTLLKRMFDISLSASLLLLLLPLLLLISALVVLESSGPILFRHKRIGKHGRAFTIWKFRSMNTAARIYECSPSTDSDPRLTSVGRVLRRFSLDELPQLFNVIKGDMSLVGPRPEMPFIVDQYGPIERLRLQAQPGMTGLWQISPARALPIHTHMEYDLFYIARQNFFLDLAILFRTFRAVFRGMEQAPTSPHSKIGELSETEVSA